MSGVHGGATAAILIPNSAALSGALADETGTGPAVFANTPTLVTPVIGVATATSINKVVVTPPATSATITPTDGTTTTLSGGTHSGTNTGDQTSVSGNAGTATALQTARAINGVNFDGTAAITVPAAAGTLTGATLAAGVTASSLTSLGTIASLVATTAALSAGTHTAMTSLGIRSTGTGAFDLTLANAENLTLGRTLTVAVGDAARTLTVGAAASVSGTNTGDNPGVTSVTGTSPVVSSGGTTPAISMPAATNAAAGHATAAHIAAIEANTAKVTNATHTGDATGATALTVVKINGTLMSGLATGVLKNTTTTGVPFISKVALTEPATAATLAIADNQTLTVNGSATITNGTHSGTNTGDQTTVSGNAGTVTNGVYTTNKDATGGVPGLTLFKINFKNAANTFTNFFTNATTAARTYTFPDKDITVAGLVDITGTNSGTNTGDQTISDATITTSDITTNNFTTAKHGFVPKGTNVGSYLKDDGTWGVPAGIGDMVLASSQTNTGLKTFLNATLGIRNVANTITSLFSTAATIARTWTLKDADGTIAFTSDITGTNSGTNTGDNATNTQYSGLVTNATHTGDATGATALTVVAINATNMAALATGILKNTTTTGVPSIAVAGDFPTLNQSTTGNAATVTTNANLTGHITSTGNAAVLGSFTSAQLATALTDETGTGAAVFGTKPAINGTNPTGATYAPATGAQTVALDCVANNIHVVSGHASGTAITFTIANATNSQPFIVSILQGGTTVSTITGWFATVRWAGGVAPTLTATLNKRDTFGFIRTGANTYDGFIVGQNC